MAEGILGFLRSLTPRQIALGLAGVSALLLVIEDRRLVIVPLLMQHILLALLSITSYYVPIVMVRLGVGVAICMMLYITATHVERSLHQSAPDADAAWDAAKTPALAHLGFGMGPAFRLVAAVLGGTIAFGLWRALPFEVIPDAYMLAAYWLISLGLLMALISADPLRMGLGVLTAINGFEIVYLSLEQSFVIIGLMGAIDLVLALAISMCAETWLEQLHGEANP